MAKQQDTWTERGNKLTKAGFAALFGRPNAGKSSLLNAMVGEKLAIVTPRPQTTRSRFTGILTRPERQAVFVDTPGIFQPKSGLDRYMASEISGAVTEVDLAVLVINPGEDFSELIPVLQGFRGRLLIAVNKMDIAGPDYAPPGIDFAEAVSGRSIDAVIPVSAATGQGIENLVSAVLSLLPESPLLFPEDQISTAMERTIVAEMIRETVMLETDDEIPYAAAVIVEEISERAGGKLFIRAEIVVERETMKPIIIGKNGSKIAAIGRLSREKIEKFLQSSVYLDLRVKCREKWRNTPIFLRSFGYREKKR